jgi:hypothetical protein
MGCPPMCVRSPNAVPFKRTRYHGGLLEWDMWARIDRNRLAGLHEYASIGPQIRLSQSQLGLLPDINKPPITPYRVAVVDFCLTGTVS